MPDAASESATDAAEAPLNFPVFEYRVRGNTLLKRTDVERAVYPYLGEARTFDDVEAARQALADRYKAAGYPFVEVFIPEQAADAGIVRLEVSETRIDRLRVTGSRYFSLARIKDEVPELKAGQVPHMPTAQAQLSQVNGLSPDRTIAPVLRPGRLPGTMEVELKVKDRLPLHGGLELNDRYTEDTSRLRLSASLRYDNLWQREHSLGVAYQVSPQNPEEVEVYSGTYLFRVPAADAIVAFYAVDSSSNLSTIGSLGPVGVIGNGFIAGVRGIKPLVARPGLSHSLTLGADYKDFGESVATLGADTLNTPISYAVFSAQYGGSYSGERGTTRGSVTAIFAPRAFGNTDLEFDEKRFGARANFAYARLNLEHDLPLPQGAEIGARFIGQVAESPLISNEQFSAGGATSVRGYLESQQLADEGYQAGVELRSPSFARYLRDRLDNLRLLAFFEGARLHMQKVLPGQETDFVLMGVGMGLRLAAWDGLSAALDWAWPLRGLGSIDAGDPRLHFNMGYEF